MASSMKGFYKQKKPSASGSKPKPKPKTSRAKAASATVGSNVTRATLDLDLTDECYDGNEELLRQFDMNMVYGPCLGMSRLARWERAHNLGLNPPEDIHCLLLKLPQAHLHCLWEGRV